MDTPTLVQTLVATAKELDTTPLSIGLADVDEARRERDEITDQVRSYLLPRLSKLDAPLLVVLGGSTGSGKSSLTNALVGAEVARPGVLRPTTRRPVLVCHPTDRSWFANEVDTAGYQAVLPELSRTAGADGDDEPGADGLRLVVHDDVPQGIGILDSPDIDSVETANHDLAALLLGAADLWLFVTTAVRYADAVPWAYLRRAAERAVAIGVVINRIPPGAEAELTDDLSAMLNDRGLGTADLFSITEGGLAEGAGAIRAWLADIAASEDARARVARQTVDGLLRSLPSRLERVSEAADAQRRAVDDLIALAHSAWDAAGRDADARLDDGIALRDEVLARFSEHVGSSELMGKIQSTVGRLRDRIASTITGKPTAETEVRQEVGDTIEQLVVRIADRTSLDIADRWESLPGGREALAVDRGLDRASPDLAQRAAKMVVDWQDAMMSMIADRAGSKAAVARGLSLGINGVGAALMIALFSQTGGLTGGEAAIAGGAAAASQTVLSAVFGDQAVRQLERDARADLLERINALYRVEDHRYAAAAGSQAPDAAGRLHELAEQLHGEVA